MTGRTHPDISDWVTMFRCDIMIPLGSPVVPVEKSTATAALRSGTAGGLNPSRGVRNNDAMDTVPSQSPNTTSVCEGRAPVLNQMQLMFPISKTLDWFPV